MLRLPSSAVDRLEISNVPDTLYAPEIVSVAPPKSAAFGENSGTPPVRTPGSVVVQTSPLSQVLPVELEFVPAGLVRIEPFVA